MSRTWITWRRQDGEPIAGEFSFVADPEFMTDELDYEDEPIAYIREAWALTAEIVEWKFPRLYGCECSCNDDAVGWYRNADDGWFAACEPHGDQYGVGPGVTP